MTFDDSGRRLITGARDGSCKVWNFNNGHCLKILRKENNFELSDVKHVKIYNNKFIVTAGWDKRITIYDDDVSDSRLYSDPSFSWGDRVGVRNLIKLSCIFCQLSKPRRICIYL
jgi:WD40 repeat protein